MSDWREEQRRSFAFGNCNIENPKVTREIVNEEAQKMAESEYGRSRSMDRRLEAQGKPVESKDAPVTEEHRKAVREFFESCTQRFDVEFDGNIADPTEDETAQFLANLQRRWQAEARLAEHELLCCGPQHGINCPRFEELALKLKELGK